MPREEKLGCATGTQGFVHRFLFSYFIMLVYTIMKGDLGSRGRLEKRRHKPSGYVNRWLRVRDLPKVGLRIWMSRVIPNRQFGGSHPIFLEGRV